MHAWYATAIPWVFTQKILFHQASKHFRNTCISPARRPVLLQTLKHTLKQVGNIGFTLNIAPLLHIHLRASIRDSPQTPSFQFQRVLPASSAQSSTESEGRFHSFDPGSEARQAWEDDPLDETLYLEEEDNSPISTTNAVLHCFWDLDNKPADGSEQAAELVHNIRAALLPYGKLATMKAFGNQHCFNYVPVQERNRRKEVQQLRCIFSVLVWRVALEICVGCVQSPSHRNLVVLPCRKVVTGEVHACNICGSKFKTHDKLTKHFTSVHEREMKKRKARLQNKGGRGRRQAATFFADEAKLSRWDRRLYNWPDRSSTIARPVCRC